jgi:exosortase J
MSAFPDSDIRVQSLRRWELSSVQFAVLSTVFAVLGLSTIWPTVLSLWTMWTTDGLKSIGMAVPLVSLVLILRVWRRLGWRADGTWWGLALVLLSTIVAWAQQQATLILVVSPHWSTPLPPNSLLLFVYAAGVVLLLGGVRLFRAAVFPIVLLWFSNPIPHVFSSLLDLPLQHLSAHIARAFAIGLGHSLTPDNLRLMFTPDFGMFIAPGCDGIRGSVAMGFIALIAGYVHGFRWYINGLVVVGAVLLGYVFNLARLCLLVLYYVVALHFSSLQNKAENADYVIGAVLFLIATLLLFVAIHRLRERSPHEVEEGASSGRIEFKVGAWRSSQTQLSALGVVVLLGCGGLVRAMVAAYPSGPSGTQMEAKRFPQVIGNYSLVRTWNETLVTGPVVYIWAQYVPTGGGTPVSLGVSPLADWHDPALCHSVRAEDPVWQGQLEVATADSLPVSFSSGFYDDGLTRNMEASTTCNGTSCGEYSTDLRHFGLVFSRPDPSTMLGDESKRPVRVLIRAESIDETLPDDVTRQQLTQDLKDFLATVKLIELVRS